jgi:GcrA cell cycle regulator
MSATSATWDTERVEALKRCFSDGMTCSQIAREIGVTRNAVIGKMNRLGLTRPRDVAAKQRERWHAVQVARPKVSRALRRKRSNVDIFSQHAMLKEVFGEAQPRPEDVPIRNGRGCTLLELSPAQCRWPINTPGAEDFCYCGNDPVKGLPYCLGHARIAYRPVGRARSSA